MSILSCFKQQVKHRHSNILNPLLSHQNYSRQQLKIKHLQSARHIPLRHDNHLPIPQPITHHPKPLIPIRHHPSKLPNLNLDLPRRRLLPRPYPPVSPLRPQHTGHRLYGTDLHQGFLHLGHELFRDGDDKDVPTLIAADFLNERQRVGCPHR